MDKQPETIIEMDSALMDKVRDGSKVISIRPGRLAYPLGPALVRDAGGTQRDIQVTILRLSHCRLKHVPYVDLAVWAGDTTTHAVLRDILSRRFPGITLDDEVPVIRYRVGS